MFPTLIEDNVSISFPVTVTKSKLIRLTRDKKRFNLAHSSRVQTIMTGKSKHQQFEAPRSPTINSREYGMLVFGSLSPHIVQNPGPGDSANHF